MIFAEVLHEIQRITALEEKSLMELALKTSEENGELAQAVLSFMKAPGCAYKKKTRADVDEEAVDVMIAPWPLSSRTRLGPTMSWCSSSRRS